MQRRQEELERLDAARRQREEHRQQFLGGGVDGWGGRKPTRDGPLGRQQQPPPPPIPFVGGPNRPPGMNGNAQQNLGKILLLIY